MGAGALLAASLPPRQLLWEEAAGVDELGAWKGVETGAEETVVAALW